MGEMFTTRVVAIWGLLIAATLTSWRLGTDHGIHDPHIVGIGVLVVAIVKVRLVGLHFMELRDAPVVLRGLFEGWCVVVCSALIGLYLFA